MRITIYKKKKWGKLAHQVNWPAANYVQPPQCDWCLSVPLAQRKKAMSAPTPIYNCAKAVWVCNIWFLIAVDDAQFKHASDVSLLRSVASLKTALKCEVVGIRVGTSKPEPPVAPVDRVSRKVAVNGKSIASLRCNWDKCVCLDRHIALILWQNGWLTIV